ncbi:hypothetical protein [Chitinophaga pinensis]|nr:hypothetical protein [Chitinophaga pinensis]
MVRKLFCWNSTKATANKDDIYSCDVDGKNLKKIYDMPSSNGHTNLSGVY